MATLRVGILRGGPSSEYNVSLSSGARVLKYLSRDKYQPVDVLVTKDGTWHFNGLPVYPEIVANEVDLFWNALHGEYGEDGTVQRLLASLGKPHTGPEEVSAMATINKPTAAAMLSRAGIKVPKAVVIVPRASYQEAAKEPFARIPPPWVVKPSDRGSAVGLSYARSFKELVAAIERASEYSHEVMIEQYIPGKECAVGTIDNFRNQAVYALLPVEVRRPDKSPIWTNEHKVLGRASHTCPGCFNDDEKSELSRLAILAHETLGLRHYSQSDFIVSPRGIYLIEVNALPGLGEHALLPRALEAVGSSYPEFLDHVITQTLGE